MFLVLVMIYPLILIVILVGLNQKGMLVGTWRYKLTRERAFAAHQVEATRQAAIMARYRMSENEMLEKSIKQLEAPKA